MNSLAKVFILEDLKTSNMTRRAAPKKGNNSNFISNRGAQKSGLAAHSDRNRLATNLVSQSSVTEDLFSQHLGRGY